MDTEEVAKPWYKSPFFWFFVIGIVSITAIRPFLRREPPPPPVLRQLPAFSLVDQNANSFTNSNLEGNVWVVNFIFTRCGSICPLLTRHMADLQELYDAYGVDEVKLLSITVDPEYDSPEILTDYAGLHEADLERWSFLTGDPDAVHEFVVGGFAFGIGEKTEDETGMMDISHTGKFALVDGQGGIRGIYDSDPEGLDEIFHRSRHVVKAMK